MSAPASVVDVLPSSKDASDKSCGEASAKNHLSSPRPPNGSTAAPLTDPPLSGNVYLDADRWTYEALCTSGVSELYVKLTHPSDRHGEESTSSSPVAEFVTVESICDGRAAVAAEPSASSALSSGQARAHGSADVKARNSAPQDALEELPKAQADHSMSGQQDCDARLDILEEVRLCNIVPVLPRTFPRYDLVQQVVPCTMQLSSETESLRPTSAAARPLPLATVLSATQREHLLHALYVSSHPSSAAAAAMLQPLPPVASSDGTVMQPAGKTAAEAAAATSAARGASKEKQEEARTARRVREAVTTQVNRIHHNMEDFTGDLAREEAREGQFTHAVTLDDGGDTTHAERWEGARGKRGASTTSDSWDSSSSDIGSSSASVSRASSRPRSPSTSTPPNDEESLGRISEVPVGEASSSLERHKRSRAVLQRTASRAQARAARRARKQQRQAQCRAWHYVSASASGAVVEWASTGAVGVTQDVEGLHAESVLRQTRTYYLPPLPPPMLLDSSSSSLASNALPSPSLACPPPVAGGSSPSDAPSLPLANSIPVSAPPSEIRSLPHIDFSKSATPQRPPTTLRAAAARQALRLAQMQRERTRYFHRQDALPAAVEQQLMAPTPTAKTTSVASQLNPTPVHETSAACASRRRVSLSLCSSPPSPSTSASVLLPYTRLGLPCACHHCCGWRPMFAQLTQCPESLRRYLDHLHVASTLPVFPHGASAASGIDRGDDDDGDEDTSETGTQRGQGGSGKKTSSSSSSSAAATGMPTLNTGKSHATAANGSRARGRHYGGASTAASAAYLATMWTSATTDEVDPAAVFPRLAQRVKMELPEDEGDGVVKKEQMRDEESTEDHTAFTDAARASSLDDENSYEWLDDAALDELVLVAVEPQGLPHHQRLLPPTVALVEVLTTKLAERLDKLMQACLPATWDLKVPPSETTEGAAATLAHGSGTPPQTAAETKAWCRAAHGTLYRAFVVAACTDIPARLASPHELAVRVRDKLCWGRAAVSPEEVARALEVVQAVQDTAGASRADEGCLLCDDLVTTYLQATARASISSPPSDSSDATSLRAHLSAIWQYATTEATTTRQETEDEILSLILGALRPTLYRRTFIMYELLRLLSSKMLFVANRALVGKYRAWYGDTPSPGAVLRLLQRGSVFARALARAFPAFVEVRPPKRHAAGNAVRSPALLTRAASPERTVGRHRSEDAWQGTEEEEDAVDAHRHGGAPGGGTRKRRRDNASDTAERDEVREEDETAPMASSPLSSASSHTPSFGNGSRGMRARLSDEPHGLTEHALPATSTASEVPSSAWSTLRFVPEFALLHPEYLERFTLWVRQTYHSPGGGPSSPTDATSSRTQQHPSQQPRVRGGTSHARPYKDTVRHGGSAASHRATDAASPTPACDDTDSFPVAAVIAAIVRSSNGHSKHATHLAGFNDPPLNAVLRSLVRRGRTMTGLEIDHYIASTVHV